MRWILYLTAALALALSGCTQISNLLNRKDPVNSLRPTISVGGSTNPATNPLLIPPGLKKQQVTPQ